MKLLVCHRDALVADAIRSVLEDEGFRVMVAENLEDAFDLAPAADVCVLDVRFEGALEGLGRIAALPSAPRVVALVDEDIRQVRAAARAGAAGWVTTADGLDRLVHMVENGDGQYRKAPLLQGNGAAAKVNRGRHQLTTREREVLAGLVRGESTKALAARLKVSPATARTHVQNVLAKLGVHSRLQAVALVVERSLVPLPFDPDADDLGMSPSGGN